MSVHFWLGHITRELAQKAYAEKIILFGSRAYGRPSKESDIDLLVVVNKPLSKKKRYQQVDKIIGDHIYPLDILVRSEEEIEERLAIGDSFFKEIMSRGKILYEKEA